MLRLRALVLSSTGAVLLACGGGNDASTGAPPAGAATTHPRYTYGTEIRFGQGGSDASYLQEGWSFPEPGFRWTSADEAVLAMTVDAPPGDAVLKVNVAMALTSAGGPSGQRVIVSGNGKRLAEWLVKEPGPREAAVPRDVLANGTLILRFGLPDAVEPMKVSSSVDSRKLGVAVRSLSLSPP